MSRPKAAELGRIAKRLKNPTKRARATPERELRRILEAIDLLSSLSPAHREHIAVRLVSEGSRSPEDATSIVARVSMDLLEALGALDLKPTRKANPLPSWVSPQRHEGYEWISMPDGARVVNAYRPLAQGETCGCGCTGEASKSA